MTIRQPERPRQPGCLSKEGPTAALASKGAPTSLSPIWMFPTWWTREQSNGGNWEVL